MKKLCIFVVCAVLMLTAARPALAVKPFYDEFEKMYAGAEGAFSALVKKEKCSVCHDPKDKKIRNPYGEALDKLLDRKTDAKDMEKIQKALKTVEAEKAKDGETFGEKIKAGKLPGA